MTNREEFETLRNRLFELADKMGMRLTMTLKRKHEVPSVAGKPATVKPSPTREPGDE